MDQLNMLGEKLLGMSIFTFYVTIEIHEKYLDFSFPLFALRFIQGRRVLGIYWLFQLPFIIAK